MTDTFSICNNKDEIESNEILIKKTKEGIVE